jgi:hypothetical protein
MSNREPPRCQWALRIAAEFVKAAEVHFGGIVPLRDVAVVTNSATGQGATP